MITINKDQNGQLKSIHIPNQMIKDKTAVTELNKLDFAEKAKFVEMIQKQQDKEENEQDKKEKK